MKIKSFKGLRPKPEYASKVACPPYDVLNSKEAREQAKDNPNSFLNVIKPEITLPEDIDHYSQEVYQTGKENFNRLLEQGVFIQDDKECLYMYELIMEGRPQTGIVACASVEDYMEDRIKKHELTRPDKENDRKNHMRISMLNAEPVFFAYKAITKLDEIVENITQNDPVYDFVADDGINHRIWVVDNKQDIDDIIDGFNQMSTTYVADGHHRTAAAALVGNDLRNENPDHTGEEEYNYFLAVHFPDNQLAIYDYNRVVTDLNGYNIDSFLQAISNSFTITKVDKEPQKPQMLHEMGMYLDGNWYQLQANPGTYKDDDPINVLDITILSEQILKPLLNIQDLQTDKRIDFVGGMRGLVELERRVNSGEMKVAFAMYPVSMQQLMDIADNGMTMPPKVTWFEPKLRSGLIVHSLDQAMN